MRVFIVIVLFSSITMLSFYRPPNVFSAKVETYYKQQLSAFSASLNDLGKLVDAHAAPTEQKAAFIHMRNAYRKMATLSEYFNPYESVQLNSAALLRTEDDNQQVIEPHGLQQLETLLWEQVQSADYASKIKFEIAFISDVIGSLARETDLENKFTESAVWECMRSALITLLTKTITAFDTPLALNAVNESIATLESVQELSGLYASDKLLANHASYADVRNLIAQAQTFVASQATFDSFDRLTFIRQFINPLSSRLTSIAIEREYCIKDERRPLKPLAENLFSSNIFDINFFSPNNRYQVTEERILLGKKLFSETKLSSSGKRSCATCHRPEMAFTDGLKSALSTDGATVLKRNTPTILNAVFQTKQFYDSRQTMLEFQVNNVVHSEQEMGGSAQALASGIKNDPAFVALFTAAYPSEAEPVNVFTIANAIANYMRSLQSLNSKFDKYMRNEADVFSKMEQYGFNLFMGKAKCGTCHFMPLFNGLVPPQFNDTESEVLGVPASLTKPYRLDEDSGKFYFTGASVHLYAFKTPTLRNIALTAPYMHNGVYNTLNQVVDFYNAGGGKGLGIAPANQSLPFDKLQLTKAEKRDIVLFLETLTDTTSYRQTY